MGDTTSSRGLGWEHQQARAEALRRLVPGTPCHHCGEPMDHTMDLDLDHLTPRVYGGAKGPRRLAHARCNRRAGQAIATARRRATQHHVERVINSRVW